MCKEQLIAEVKEIVAAGETQDKLVAAVNKHLSGEAAEPEAAKEEVADEAAPDAANDQGEAAASEPEAA